MCPFASCALLDDASHLIATCVYERLQVTTNDEMNCDPAGTMLLLLALAAGVPSSNIWGTCSAEVGDDIGGDEVEFPQAGALCMRCWDARCRSVLFTPSRLSAHSSPPIERSLNPSCFFFLFFLPCSTCTSLPPLGAATPSTTPWLAAGGGTTW